MTDNNVAYDRTCPGCRAVRRPCRAYGHAPEADRAAADRHSTRLAALAEREADRLRRAHR